MVDILHAFKLLLYIVSQSTSPNIDGPVEHQGYVVDLFRIGSVFMETPEWQKQKKWWKGSEPVIEAENSCEKMSGNVMQIIVRSKMGKKWFVIFMISTSVFHENTFFKKK